MKSIMNHPIFRCVTFAALFIVASLCGFEAAALSIPFASPSIKGFFYFLPTIATLCLPLLSLIVYFMYWHTFSSANKWKILHYYTIVIGIIALACLLGNVFIVFVGKYDLEEITSLFPYDVLAVDIGFLISTLTTGAYVCKFRDNLKIKATNTTKLSVRRMILSILMIIFSAYWLGDALSVFINLIQYIDENMLLMIPIFITFLYGTIEMVLYIIYKNLPDFDSQFNYYKKALFFALIGYLLLNTLEVAVIMINPNMFAESMNPYLLLQPFVGFPLGIYVATGLPLIPLIGGGIKFGKLKNEQKRKENADKK